MDLQQHSIKLDQRHMSETEFIHRPKSPAIDSISLPAANPALIVLKAAVAPAMAVTGSIN